MVGQGRLRPADPTSGTFLLQDAMPLARLRPVQGIRWAFWEGIEMWWLILAGVCAVLLVVALILKKKQQGQG
jgi:LPXTG-motif cell wall-anchored protein